VKIYKDGSECEREVHRKRASDFLLLYQMMGHDFPDNLAGWTMEEAMGSSTPLQHQFIRSYQIIK
jgi:hypothetical protein